MPASPQCQRKLARGCDRVPNYAKCEPVPVPFNLNFNVAVDVDLHVNVDLSVDVCLPVGVDMNVDVGLNVGFRFDVGSTSPADTLAPALARSLAPRGEARE